MRRRRFLISIGYLSALARAGDLLAQQRGKISRIGFLWPLMPDSTPERLAAFRQGLKELGYVEGNNISIDDRFAEAKYDRLPALAANLVDRKVDIILASTTPASLAARNATKTIPIVFVNVADPVAVGLVSSLAR